MIFDKLKDALAGKDVYATQKDKVKPPKPRKVYGVPEGLEDEPFMKKSLEKMTISDESGPEVVEAMPREKKKQTENLMLRSRTRRPMRGME